MPYEDDDEGSYYGGDEEIRVCYNCHRLNPEDLECMNCSSLMCAKCSSISRELCKPCYSDRYLDDEIESETYEF